MSVTDIFNNSSSAVTQGTRTFSVESSPQAVDDMNLSTPQNTSILIDVLDNDINVIAGVVVVIATQPTSGTAVVQGSGLSSMVLYNPNQFYSGPDSFIYMITNVDGGTASGTVNIQVGPVDNDLHRALLESSSQITRGLSIYENDGVTPYLLDAPLVSGSVAVDAGRSDRRRADITIYNLGNLDAVETELWYDKVFEIRRGIVVNGGEYLPIVFTGKIEQDKINHFSNGIDVTLRDMSIVLDQEFGVFEEYAPNSPLENVVRDIALAGGITLGQMSLPLTGLDTGLTELVYAPSSKRWRVMKDLCETHEQDLFFDATGILVMRPFPRLVGSAVEYLFETGESGNIGEFTKSRTQAPIRNAIAVVGETTANGSEFYGYAENVDPTSPTRIDLIGRRPHTVTRPNVTSNAHAQSLAELLLEDAAKERFDISSNAIPDPRLEANILVQFDRPDVNAGETNRYILESFDLPLSPGPSSIKVSKMNETV